jgi:hypothetical protein
VTSKLPRARVHSRYLSRFFFCICALAGAAVATAADVVTITGSPASSIAAGSSYSFTPTGKSSAGKKITYSITGKPSWATFSGTNGNLAGKPTSANVGKYSNIGIQANDGTALAMLWFSITVTSSGTSAVKISGTPASSVAVGKTYKFQPTASDSAGRSLSFSVKNKPTWASFSIANGTLSGTPTSSQMGTYSSIVVSASDGVASSSLPAFSIKVTSGTTGSATLEWTDPTQNTNGSKLTNLAGIRIYYGTSSSSLNHQVTVASTTDTSYTVSGLASGTWYFGATAYNTAGVESKMSALSSKAIP